MICARCHHSNPEGTGFCNGCGAALAQACPVCRAENPPGSRFCGRCGAEMGRLEQGGRPEPDWESRLARIQRYLPDGLSDRVLAQRDKLEGERKQVTVLFADLAGFTSLAERLTSEEAYLLMDRISESLIHSVHRFGGTVNQLSGDGVMALFGAPLALENAPQRALLSASDIHRSMEKLGLELKREQSGLPALNVRVGVNSGPVVVGSVGNDLRVEFTAIGDTVNLASRLVSLAEPGRTCLSAQTKKLTEGLFKFQDLGLHTVKGKSSPVRAYCLADIGSGLTRFQAQRRRGLTPLVGRDSELELLAEAARRAVGGAGQVVSLVGEAGMGKTRLAHEFASLAEGMGLRLVEGRCLPYGRGAPYHPFGEIMRTLFGMEPGEPADAARSRVVAGLEAWGLGANGAVPYLLEILSLPDSGLDPVRMSREARREGILGALKRVLVGGALKEPLALVLEDLHWADPSTIDGLGELATSLGGDPLMLLLTHRPDFTPPWRARSFHAQISLNRLPSGQSRLMVDLLPGGPGLGAGLRDAVVERAGGVPFFLEELVRWLAPGGGASPASEVEPLELPAGVEEVIMARVDRLPEGAKRLLKAASVLDGPFDRELLGRVLSVPPEEVEPSLSILVEAEMIYERGAPPRQAYVFKQPLIREAVYASLLSGRRRQVHHAVALALEDMYGAEPAEHYEALAGHHQAAGDYRRAAHYCGLACKKAEKTAAFSEVLSFARRRVRCLETLPPDPEVSAELVDARTSLGLYQFLVGRLAEAKEAVAPALSPAQSLDRRQRLSQIHTVLGVYAHMVEEEAERAREHLSRARDLAEETGDVVSLLFANYLLGMALAWDCRFERTMEYVEKSLSMVGMLNIQWSMAVMKSTLALYACNLRGRVDQGRALTAEGLALAEESGDVYSRAVCATCHGVSLFQRGEMSGAAGLLAEAAGLSSRIRLASYGALARHWLGRTLWARGETDKAVESFAQARDLRRESGLFPSAQRLLGLAVARGRSLKSAPGPDLDALRRAVEGNRLAVYQGCVRRYLGEILTALGEEHFTEAAGLLNQARDTHQRLGMDWEKARDHISLAGLEQARGRPERSSELLGTAADLFEQCGAPVWARRCRAQAQGRSAGDWD